MGRPRQFERDDVLERVTDLFWCRGYEATGVAEIAEETGLNKSSLYRTFGSKDELYRAALERYGSVRVGAITAELAAGSAGLDDLLELISFLRSEAAADTDHRGCFMVGAASEVGPHDPDVSRMAAEYRRALRTALRGVLERASAAGEIAPDSIATYVELLVIFLNSAALIVRSGADTAEIDAHFDAMAATIESWRRGVAT